jgi:uncharacterized membrane protein
MRLFTTVTLALMLILAVTLPVTAVGALPDSTSEATAPVADFPKSLSTAKSAESDSQPTVNNQSPLEPADPAQSVHLNVTTSGDLEWTIESRFLLSDDAEIDAFTEYADSVVDDERNGVYGPDLFEPHLDVAKAETDRDMPIENESWDVPRIDSAEQESSEEETVGTISYSFTWTNFATVDGTQIHFGDAFETGSGPWLSTLTADQQLVIQSPPGYGFHEYGLAVNPQNGDLIAEGPEQFEEGDLEGVFLRGADGSSGGEETVDSHLLSGQWLAGGGAFVLLLVVGAGYLLVRRSHGSTLPAFLRDERFPWSRPDDGAGATAETDDPDETERAADGSAAVSADSSETHHRSGHEFAYTEDQIDDAESDDVDPELLSDEERVLRLLRRNGGPMKQASLVAETGWSNAKVSQLLSKMDESDEIAKLRIGRENLITLPEVDPTEID